MLIFRLPQYFLLIAAAFRPVQFKCDCIHMWTCVCACVVEQTDRLPPLPKAPWQRFFWLLWFSALSPFKYTVSPFRLTLPRSLCLHHLLLSHLYVPMLSVSTLSRDLFGFSLPSSKEKRLCSLDPSLFQKSLLAISLFHSVLTLDFSFLLIFFSFLAFFLLAYQVSVSSSFLIFFPPIFNFASS